MKKITIPWKKHGFDLWQVYALAGYKGELVGGRLYVYKKELNSKNCVEIEKYIEIKTNRLFLQFRVLGDTICHDLSNGGLYFRDINRDLQKVQLSSWDKLFEGQAGVYGNRVEFSLEATTQEDLNKFMEYVNIFYNDLQKLLNLE